MRVALLIALVSPAVFAVDPQAILGSEERATQVQPVEELPVVSLKSAERVDAWYVSLQGGYTMRNYSLLSSTGSIYVPRGSGYELRAHIEKEWGQNRKVMGAFSYGSQAMASASTTPSAFSVRGMQGVLQYSHLIAGMNSPRTSSWWLAVGYQIKQRTGAVSGVAGVPDPMTDVLFHGIRLGVRYESPVRWGKFGWGFSTYFHIPVFFRETSQSTGFYRFGFSNETAVDLTYEVRETFVLSVGPRFSVDYRQFGGVASRGSTDATEFETVITVPLELRVRF